MRPFVALIGISSVVAAFGLVLALGVTARTSGDFSSTVLVIALAAALASSTAYQIFRLLKYSAKPEFSKHNLSPIAALLLLGAVVGLTMVAGAISDGGHGMALLIPGFLIHLILTCVARYKFAT
jgi:hypothetical protein